MKITHEFLNNIPRGHFYNSNTGETFDHAPLAPDHGFPICAGPWPNQYADAVQAQCKLCEKAVGLSPRGMELHRENPAARPILCQSCFVPFCTLLQSGIDPTDQNAIAEFLEREGVL